jgi:hypothetical protein
VLISSAVGRAKDDWTIDAVYTTSKPHNDVVIAIHPPYSTLRALERSEGMTGSAIGRIIS